MYLLYYSILFLLNLDGKYMCPIPLPSSSLIQGLKLKVNMNMKVEGDMFFWYVPWGEKYHFSKIFQQILRELIILLHPYDKVDSNQHIYSLSNLSWKASTHPRVGLDKNCPRVCWIPHSLHMVPYPFQKIPFNIFSMENFSS